MNIGVSNTGIKTMDDGADESKDRIVTVGNEHSSEIKSCIKEVAAGRKHPTETVLIFKLTVASAHIVRGKMNRQPTMSCDLLKR